MSYRVNIVSSMYIIKRTGLVDSVYTKAIFNCQVNNNIKNFISWAIVDLATRDIHINIY